MGRRSSFVIRKGADRNIQKALPGSGTHQERLPSGRVMSPGHEVRGFLTIADGRGPGF